MANQPAAQARAVEIDGRLQASTMKFELAPYNRDLADDVLLDDLRQIARQLGKSNVTKEDYEKLGRVCCRTIQKRFGSWSKAQEMAGLRKIRHFGVSEEDCVAELKRVAEELKTATLTTAQYSEHGQYSLPVVTRRCGSFKRGLQLAGLSQSPNAKDKISHEALFENLERLWEALGRQPTRNDFQKPLSRFSYAPYPRRFGSYRKALEAFVASFDSESISGNDELLDAATPCIETQAVANVRKTSRSVSWRLRFLVMRRDDFKCRNCGVSPALKPGTILVIDHIIPWASGGETTFENLQTLCEPCNGGKSNLPLIEDK